MVEIWFMRMNSVTWENIDWGKTKKLRSKKLLRRIYLLSSSYIYLFSFAVAMFFILSSSLLLMRLLYWSLLRLPLWGSLLSHFLSWRMVLLWLLSYFLSLLRAVLWLLSLLFLWTALWNLSYLLLTLTVLLRS